MREDHDAVLDGHRFALGHTVRLSRSLVLPNVAGGDYTIIALLPARDGTFQYRIKSKLEPYERVVKEDDFAD
jgi:hypothetical protein